MKKIFDLTAKEAQQHFMNAKSYFTNPLPTHFNLQPVLKAAKKAIGEKTLAECKTDAYTIGQGDVNLHMALNKDGRYGYRPIQMSNPYLYWMLVRNLTKAANWKMIAERFEDYSSPLIATYGLPVVKEEKDVEAFENATTILNWWEKFEQQSIEFSLYYDSMFSTDLTNCYGNISHAVLRKAFTGEGTQKAEEGLSDLADKVCSYLALMQNGNTVGLPQGAEIYDVLAELVLAYADELLWERLQARNIKGGFRIIRYRDDYRIFAREEIAVKIIVSELQGVLIDLGLFMNSRKTSGAENIVSDSVKTDKLYYITNTPILNKKGVDFDGLQKHLMFIHEFARKFPGGGQIVRLMSEFDKRLKTWIDSETKKREKKAKENEAKAELWEAVDLASAEGNAGNTTRESQTPVPILRENIIVMSAIVADIVIFCPRAISMAMTVISRMTDTMIDKAERDRIRLSVAHKILRQPNTAYHEVWLQQLTYGSEFPDLLPEYTFPLCKLVEGMEVKLWANNWLKPSIAMPLPVDKIFTGKVESIIAPQMHTGYHAAEASPICTL